MYLSNGVANDGNVWYPSGFELQREAGDGLDIAEVVELQEMNKNLNNYVRVSVVGIH